MMNPKRPKLYAVTYYALKWPIWLISKPFPGQAARFTNWWLGVCGYDIEVYRLPSGDWSAREISR